jgi:hypothetical protein
MVGGGGACEPGAGAIVRRGYVTDGSIGTSNEVR